MTITHIVLVEFQPTVTPEQLEEGIKGMFALKDKCLHPTSQQPYIKSLTGGINNSPEGLSGGLTHGFVIEFASAEDRDYYVHTDPAHKDLGKIVGQIAQSVRVVDYEQGKF